MTDVTLKLDPVSLREATVQAVMGLLTPEMKHLCRACTRKDDETSEGK